MKSIINLFVLFINIFNLQHFFSYRLRLLDVSGAQWSCLWRCACRVKTAKGSATVHRQPRSTHRGMFVQPFYFVSYYFLELNMMIYFLIFKRHIIVSWGRDTGMILRPTWILIWIYGWRQDRLVDSIKGVPADDSTMVDNSWCSRLESGGSTNPLKINRVELLCEDFHGNIMRIIAMK